VEAPANRPLDHVQPNSHNKKDQLQATPKIDGGSRLSGRILRVSVRDGGNEFPKVRPFDPEAPRGRGLQVVTTLAVRWGCDRHEHGKTVWVDLAA
jgi:hypothetical protein